MREGGAAPRAPGGQVHTGARPREETRSAPGGAPQGRPRASAQTPPSPSACHLPTREGREAGPCRLCPQVLGTGPGWALGAPRVSTSQGAHGGLSRVMREALAWEGTAPLALPGRCPQRPWARSALGTGASPPPLSVVPNERHVWVLGTTLDTLLGDCSAPAGSHTSRGLCRQEDRWAEEGGGLPGVHHPPGPPR